MFKFIQKICLIYRNTVEEELNKEYYDDQKENCLQLLRIYNQFSIEQQKSLNDTKEKLLNFINA